MSEEVIRVLLIEDDEDDYILTRDLLSEIPNTQYSLAWAAIPEVGWEAIEKQAFDIYLLDHHLGALNGLLLLERAKSNGIQVPIIVLTGQDDRQTDLDAMRAGAADYLVKGQITPQILERSIRYSLEQARLLNRLNALTIRDGLTGLYNRREMDRLLEEEVFRHQRYGRPLSLVMADIDHFKRVNDAHGHPVGDKALQWIAQQFQENARSVDRVIRYGGEEFTVVLPETGAGEAYLIAERLRLAIASQPCRIQPCSSQEPLHVPLTISMGVAELPTDAGSQDELITASDQALYTAKDQGRNRVVMYGSMEAGEKPADG
jgi:diguanylate cyclase (GGDEF)-like protein